MLDTIPSKFKTQDESDPVNTSPLTVGSTQIALKVPKSTKAMKFTYWVESYAIRVSEVDGMARYTKVLPGGSDVIGCVETDYIYVKRDGGVDATLHFRFDII